MDERNISSDFIDDISEIGDVVPVNAEFSGITECYVSKHGYTRLFKANRFGKTYMLKCLRRDFLYTSLYRTALSKEFEIGLQFDHMNICRTIGMEEVEGIGPAIILEYVDGDTLEDFMGKGLLTMALARKFVGQLVDVLGYLHSKQTIHRDLKPSNIMVTHKGQNIKLIDFSLSDNDTFNVLKIPGGTSGYIAPELFLPNAKSGILCDIYSFGVLMANMAEATCDKTMMKTARHCMSRQPENRPQSMQEITIGEEYTAMQMIAVVILSVTAIALIVCIVVRLLQFVQ